MTSPHQLSTLYPSSLELQLSLHISAAWYLSGWLHARLNALCPYLVVLLPPSLSLSPLPVSPSLLTPFLFPLHHNFYLHFYTFLHSLPHSTLSIIHTTTTTTITSHSTKCPLYYSLSQCTSRCPLTRSCTPPAFFPAHHHHHSTYISNANYVLSDVKLSAPVAHLTRVPR